jgi:DNA-binding MarR family transcriptional regulator
MTDKVDLTARRIMEVVPMVMRTLASEMRCAGHLTVPAHGGLLVILAEGPHNLSELADKHAVSLPTMSSSISTLVERGWVTRSRAPDDRRKVQVELTPAGRTALEAMSKAVEERLARKLSCLSPTECERVLAVLELLHGCFARLPSDERTKPG